MNDAAIGWSEQVRTIAAFGATLPPANSLTIRYEDLLRDPAAVLKTVGAFLGIANHGALIETIAPALRPQVWEGNAGKSSRLLSPRETECFEAIAADVLEQNGYALRVGRAARPMTLTESVRWRARGVWIRAGNRKYWADNQYKIRLRLREALLTLRRAPEPVPGHPGWGALRSRKS